MKKLTAKQKKRLRETLYKLSPEARLNDVFVTLGEMNEKIGDTSRLDALENKFGAALKVVLERSEKAAKGTAGLLEETRGAIAGQVEALGKTLAPKNYEKDFLLLTGALAEMQKLTLEIIGVAIKEIQKVSKTRRDGGGGGGTSWEFTRLDGTVDGSNAIFTIPSSKVTPRSDAIVLVWNAGAFQQSVEGDWTRDGGTFTFTFAPAQTPAVLYEK